MLGASYKSWNSGAPATGAHGFYGVIDDVLVKPTADDAGRTANVRRSLFCAFAVVPQAANDTLVIEGDSGTVSWGSVFLLVPYHDAVGNLHPADTGVDGYGLNWMMQRKLSRRVRFIQLGRVGCSWRDPATDTTVSNFYNRLGALRAQYNPKAKRNICVAYQHGGVDDGNPGAADLVYDFMRSWLEALRADGQNWTMILGLMWGAKPGGGVESFNRLIRSNSVGLGISYFTELEPAQTSAVLNAPNNLRNLYDCNEINGRCNGHGSPLLYAIESSVWARAVNVVL